MNLSKTGTCALLSIIFPQVNAGDANLIQNGGFENGENLRAAQWGANCWGGATGKYGRGTNTGASGRFCYEVKRTNGKGGIQLYSAMININGKMHFTASFKYKGKAYFQLRFMKKENGKYVVLRNSYTKKPVVITKTLNSEQWKSCKFRIKLPAEYAGNQLGMRIYFLLFPSHPHLSVDDIKIVQPDAPSKPAAVTRKSSEKMDWLQIMPPDRLSSRERNFYSPFPGPGFKYGMRNGVLTRDGKPFFFLGNFTVGGGQWNVASSWLARVQKNSYLTVTWGLGSPSEKISVKNNKLCIEYKDTAPLYSWLRELSRYGMLTQFDPGNAMYKYNPLRRFVKKFPGLEQFYVQGSHFYSFDHNTRIGREMHFNTWKNYFRYIRNAPLLAFECFNELGYTPSHARVIRGFREFTKKKYGSLSEANRCWKTGFKAWSDVKPPHLGDSRKIMSYSDVLFLLKKCREENIYYDWIMFLQQDLIPGLIAMKKDFRKLSSAPFALDWRGHNHEFDNYVTADLDLLDKVVDLHFLHTAFLIYSYNNMAADEQSVMLAHTRSLLAHNFVASNSSKPIINPESIYSMTTTPGSNLVAMDKSSYGKLHREWNFRLEQNNGGIAKGYYKVGFDDSRWDKMMVPGCWDSTGKYKGKNGWGWYRTTFEMPGNVKMSYLDGSRKFLLVGKGVAQSATIWLNGHKVGSAKGWNTEYEFDIGAYLNFGGRNTVVVLVDGTTSYSQGIRFYFHIIRDDMLNKRRPLEKKEYAMILWTNIVAGCSGITLWNWDDVYRPFMPELVTELNSVSQIVLPEARKSKARTAMLMPYLYFRGLPAYGRHLDYLAYFSAMNFLQTPVNVLSEDKFSKITPERYPMVLVPYAWKVHKKTFEHLCKYVEDGGFAIITFDSLCQEFERYSNLPVDRLTGVKIAGKISGQPVIILDGQSLELMKTKNHTTYGVKIIPEKSVRVIARFKDGSPAVTIKKHSKGTVCFIAGRLNMKSAHIMLKKLLALKRIAPELQLISSNKKEFPFIQSRYLGTPDRFLIYCLNWGGKTHNLNVRIPAEKLRTGKYRLRSVRGNQKINRSLDADDLARGIVFAAPSMDPVVLLAESEKISPLRLKKVSPLRTEIFRHINQLNKDDKILSNAPVALFMDDIQSGGRYAVGRKLYPLVAEFMARSGYKTMVLPWREFTPASLKKVKTVFLAEDISNYYSIIMRKNGRFVDDLLDFVRNGGSLIIVSSSAHPNSRHLLLNVFGKKLGFSVSSRFSRNPASCGYGDPLQIKVNDFSQHPLASNVNKMQMFVAPVFNLRSDSQMKTVALTAPDDLNNPSKPVIIAGRLGKGRIVAATDLLWLQPFRLDAEDNAQFLMNMVRWTLGKPVKKYSRSELAESIFINSKLMDEIEKQESVK